MKSLMYIIIITLTIILSIINYFLSYYIVDIENRQGRYINRPNFISLNIEPNFLNSLITTSDLYTVDIPNSPVTI